jgi:hypothetical protein
MVRRNRHEAETTEAVVDPNANGQTPEGTVVTEPTNGPPPDHNGSTVPNGERRDPPGEKPIMKLGPFPTSEKRTFLSLAIWKKDVVVEGGEVVPVFNVGLSRTYYNGSTGNEPKTSSTIRASEIPLAVMMLQNAQSWIASQKTS